MDPESQQALLQFHLWDMEEKEADRQHLKSYACPCKKCMGAKVLLRKTIRKHLQQYGRDPEFKKSILVCMVDVTNNFAFFFINVFMGCYLVAYDIAFQHVGNKETLCACRNNYCFAFPNVQYSSIQKKGRVQYIRGPTHADANCWNG